LDIDTTGGRPTLVRGSAEISNLKPVGGNIVTGYSHFYDTSNTTDTLIVDSLTFSTQFTQVSGRLRGIRRDVTPPDTVTFEFESIIPRTYQ
jgi:predicted NUDIX family NTP pyrophosphohydrolase